VVSPIKPEWFSIYHSPHYGSWFPERIASACVRTSWYSMVVLLLITRYATQPSSTTRPIASGSVIAVAAVCATAHTAPYAAAAGDTAVDDDASGSATT